MRCRSKVASRWWFGCLEATILRTALFGRAQDRAVSGRDRLPGNMNPMSMSSGCSLRVPPNSRIAPVIFDLTGLPRSLATIRPSPHLDGHSLILHIIPFSAFDSRVPLPLGRDIQWYNTFPPLGLSYPNNFRINVDGLLTLSAMEQKAKAHEHTRRFIIVALSRASPPPFFWPAVGPLRALVALRR